MISCSVTYSKARKTTTSRTTDKISSDSKLTGQELQQLSDIDCDVEPDSERSQTRVPVVSVRLKKSKIISKSTKGATRTSSHTKSQILANGARYAREKKSSKVNKSSKKISYSLNTSMKPSCSKLLDDKPVSDIEFDMDAESEKDSSTTRFPVTAKRLKQNKVIRRQGDKIDVSVCVLDGCHDEIVSSMMY